MKGIYNLAKKQMGWKSKGPPMAFLKDGILTRSPIEIARIQMEHFHNKIEKLTSCLPITRQDPLKTLKIAFSRWKKTGEIPAMKLQPISLSQTAGCLKKLGNGMSFGNDTIDSLSVKLAAESLIAPLNFLTNLSLKERKFGNKWKVARVIPLYKGGGESQLEPDSFRPISLLPVTGKLVEMAVHSQIMEFIAKNSLWNRNNHAYRKSHSTGTAMIQLNDQITEAADRNTVSTIMAIDQSAAFDSICHKILIDKMRIYNFDDVTLAWIDDYLKYRSQYVTVGGTKSMIKTVCTGIPQGSVLGPTLYSIYVNELADVINDHENCTEVQHEDTDELFGDECRKCGNITNYADDSTFHIASKHRETIQETLDNKIKQIESFLTTNRLTMNISKTTLMEIMLKQKRSRLKGDPPTLKVRTGNRTVSSQEEVSSQNEVSNQDVSIQPESTESTSSQETEEHDTNTDIDTENPDNFKTIKTVK